MPASRPEFDQRLSRLKAELADQGRAVRLAIESAVDALFDADPSKARQTIERDHAIDREDIRIERAAVSLLHDATASAVTLEPSDVRIILTIVKVNNELERIADSAAVIAEKAQSIAASGLAPPPRFRMMANSVIGIMQTTNNAFENMDRIAAEIVLASDDATEAFKQALLLETLQDVAHAVRSPEHALALQTIAANLGRMADHCTNIAEQVIYVVTGKIVRHEGDRWTKPQDLM